MLCSAASGDAKHDHSAILSTDSVLNVDHIKKGGRRLGKDVTLVEITGGAHDLALSPAPARKEYFAAAGNWLAQRF